MTTPRWVTATAPDGHSWKVLMVQPEAPRRTVVWLPALGVAARHYEPLATALAKRGIAVFVHEWRGLGSSSLRASRAVDWGYAHLLLHDIPRTRALAADVAGARTIVLGGHSLGGQLATCAAALDPVGIDALWLVASGSPHPSGFPFRTAWWLPAAYRLLAAIANVNGRLPGRRLGFGGNEARGVIRDWSTTALTGRYRAAGIGDMESALSRLQLPVRAAVMETDWLAPEASMRVLVAKTASTSVVASVLDRTQLQVPADHFAWMRAPGAVAGFLAADD